MGNYMCELFSMRYNAVLRIGDNRRGGTDQDERQIKKEPR